VRALAASAAATLEGPIVLGFSGTSDRLARQDLETLAAELASARGSDVAVGYLTQAQPDVATAIKSISAQGVVCYTLWPGMFTDRITAAATAAGIPCTAALWQNPLLAHAVIEVVDALSR
jgi:sirohydrochlorin ferrochelatase